MDDVVRYDHCGWQWWEAGCEKVKMRVWKEEKYYSGKEDRQPGEITGKKLAVKPHLPVKWRLTVTKTRGFCDARWNRTGPPPNAAELNRCLTSIERRR
jgi:hypothetical protein